MTPKDWCAFRLGEIASLDRGKFSARPRNDPKYYGGEIPFIQTGDVTSSNGKITSYSQTLNDKGLSVSRLFPRNTLFFTIAANIGDLGIAQFATACPDSLIAITPKKYIDKQWLYQALKAKKKEFESIATLNAQLNINLEKLNPYILLVPPSAEQRAIATALSDVDGLLDALDKLIAKKQAIKQAAMQELLNGERRLPGFDDEWINSKLGVIADIIDPHPSHRAPPEISNGIPFVGIGDISIEGNIDIASARGVHESVYWEHKARYDINDGLIGIGRVASIGKVVRLRSDIGKYTVSPTIAVIRTKSLDINYLYYYLSSVNVTKQFEKISSGSTRQSVGMNVLREIMINIPEKKSEQANIAAVLSDMDLEISALKKRWNKTMAIKKGMMQELLTGRIRLIDTTKEAA